MSRSSSATTERVRRSPSPQVTPSSPAPLRLVRSSAAGIDAAVPDDSDGLSDTPAFTAIDVDEDIESVVPMPPSIPRALRRVLTKAFTDRFDYYADLDVWLHLPHPALGAECPFERLVAGDGWSVLRALVGAKAGHGALVAGSTASRAGRSSQRLRLAR